MLEEKHNASEILKETGELKDRKRPGRRARANSPQMLITWRAGDIDIQEHLNRIIAAGESKSDYIRRLIRQDSQLPTT